MQVQSVSTKQPVSQKQSTAKKIAGVAGKAVLSAGVGVLASAGKVNKLPISELEDLSFAISAKMNKDAFIEKGKQVIETGNKMLKEYGGQPPMEAPAELAEKAYERAISTFNTMGKSIAKTMAIASVATFATLSAASAIVKGIKAHKANTQE